MVTLTQSLRKWSQLLALISASICFAPLLSAQPRGDLSAEAAPSRGAANTSPEVAQKSAAIARQTMSPFCPGRTLSDCPSEYATQWRKDIRAMVAAGMSASEIQKELESRVGQNLSGSPNRNAGYGVSIGLALGAALILFFVLSKLRDNGRRSRREEQGGATSSGGRQSPVSGEKAKLVDDARLDQELALADGEED